MDSYIWGRVGIQPSMLPYTRLVFVTHARSPTSQSMEHNMESSDTSELCLMIVVIHCRGWMGCLTIMILVLMNIYDETLWEMCLQIGLKPSKNTTCLLAFPMELYRVVPNQSRHLGKYSLFSFSTLIYWTLGWLLQLYSWLRWCR